MRNADYLVLLISEAALMSKWVKFETDVAFADKRAKMKMKIIPVIVGYIKIPRRLQDKIYVKITKFDSKIFEEILKTIFQDYYILRVYLNKNFDFDIPKTKPNIETYYKLRPRKP